MRDTNALRSARDNERNPYERRFTFPKWTRTVTVLDEHRLFARLPEFSGWSKARHEQTARDYLAAMRDTRTLHNAILAIYERHLGTDGPLISGGFREPWPDYAKDYCRYHAQRTTEFSAMSLAHWQAAGKRIATWREERDRIIA